MSGKSLIKECGGKCMMHRLTLATDVCEDCNLVMCPQCASLHQKKYQFHHPFSLVNKCNSILAKHEKRKKVAVSWANMRVDEILTEAYKARDQVEGLIRKLDEIAKVWIKTILVAAVKAKENFSQMYDEDKRVEIKIDEIKWLIKTGKYWTVYSEDREVGETKDIKFPTVRDIFQFPALKKDLIGEINKTLNEYDTAINELKLQKEDEKEQKKVVIKVVDEKEELNENDKGAEKGQKDPKDQKKEENSKTEEQEETWYHKCNVLQVVEPEATAMMRLKSQPMESIKFISFSNYVYGNEIVSLLLSTLKNFPNITSFYISKVTEK